MQAVVLHTTRYDANFHPAVVVEREVTVALWQLATGSAYWWIKLGFGVGTCSLIYYKKRFYEAYARSDFSQIHASEHASFTNFANGLKSQNLVGAIDGSHTSIQKSYMKTKQVTATGNANIAYCC